MEEVVVNKKQDDSSFRDRIATVDEKGKRKWVFAQKPKGKFYNARTYVSWFFFILFFTLPFIEVKGRPLFLFNNHGDLHHLHCTVYRSLWKIILWMGLSANHIHGNVLSKD
jgi:hypothetical protein